MPVCTPHHNALCPPHLTCRRAASLLVAFLRLTLLREMDKLHISVVVIRSDPERSPHKSEGRCPSRENRPLRRPIFSEDLVRFQITTLFSRNYSGLTGSARVSLTLPLSHWLLEFPRCHRCASKPPVAARVSLPNLLMATVYSLLPGRFLFPCTVGLES